MQQVKDLKAGDVCYVSGHKRAVTKVGRRYVYVGRHKFDRESGKRLEDSMSFVETVDMFNERTERARCVKELHAWGINIEWSTRCLLRVDTLQALVKVVKDSGDVKASADKEAT